MAKAKYEAWHRPNMKLWRLLMGSCSVITRPPIRRRPLITSPAPNQTIDWFGVGGFHYSQVAVIHVSERYTTFYF